MQEFLQIDVNGRKKWKEKKQAIKEKIVKQEQNSQNILLIQKHIRKYIALKYLQKTISSDNERYFYLKNIPQHEIKMFWVTSKYQNVGTYTVKKLIFMTLKIYENESPNNQNLMNNMLGLIIQREIDLNKISKQNASLLLKTYLSKVYNFKIYQLIAKFINLKRKFGELINEDNEFFIKILYTENHKPIIGTIITLKKISSEHIEQKDINILLNCYNKVLSFHKQINLEQQQILIEKCCELFFIMKTKMIHQLKAQIIKKYNISKQLLKSTKQQFEQMVYESSQWQYLLDQFKLDEINMDKIVLYMEFNRSKWYLKEVILLISLKYKNLPFYKNLGNVHNLLKQVENVKTYNLQTEEKFRLFYQILFELLENTFQHQSDKQFYNFFKDQTQTLKALIKNMTKILLALLFSKYCELVSPIIHCLVSILGNLYNKVFRTKVIETTNFQYQAVRSKLAQFRYRSQNNIQEMSIFLKNCSFVFPLIMRLQKFKQFIVADYRDFIDTSYYHNNETENKIVIRRNHQFEDAFDQMKKINLRKRFRIQFINQYGLHQQGIDAGGLTKQFINRVLKCVLNPHYGMFIENQRHQLLPHPIKAEISKGQTCQYYQFIGKLFGKALYERITIAPKFAGPFLNTLVGRKNNFDDLKQLDPTLHKSLNYILSMEEDVELLMLTFQYHDQQRKKLINLRYNGHLIGVTNKNKEQYVRLLSNYKVNKLLQYQSRYIRRGLTQVLNEEWLAMFNYEELNYLISGTGRIDIKQLRYYSKIGGGYKPSDTTIQIFWEVVDQFSEEDKSNLLMFVTACPRPSFLGFKDLSPPFTIVKNQDIHKLPTASTCSNCLILPDYKYEKELKQKLLISIRSESGFEFG